MPSLLSKSLRLELPKRILLLMTTRTYRGKAFIQAANLLGLDVVKAIDMNKKLADYWEYPLGLDYSDPRQAVASIVNFSRSKPFGAILSVDDSGSHIAALASDALGLPHNSPEAAEAARDKFRMRQLLSQERVSSPKAVLHYFESPGLNPGLHSIAEETIYPCVIKPLNLNGSRGVIRTDSPKQFIEAAHRLKRLLYSIDPSLTPKPFIVEEYVPGGEVALEGILDNGSLHILAIFDKPEPLVGPFFEETIYVTPSRLPPATQEAIEITTSAAAKALGLQEGPVHAELRIAEQGPSIIEIAGRSIGGLCSNTLRFGTDISLEELILQQAFGLEIASLEREQLAGGVMMIPIPGEGLLKKINGCEAAESIPLIESVEITARINNIITPLPEGDGYLGFIFARGQTPEAVESALREAHRELSFEISPSLPLLPS